MMDLREQVTLALTVIDHIPARAPMTNVLALLQAVRDCGQYLR